MESTCWTFKSRCDHLHNRYKEILFTAFAECFLRFMLLLTSQMKSYCFLGIDSTPVFQLHLFFVRSSAKITFPNSLLQWFNAVAKRLACSVCSVQSPKLLIYVYCTKLTQKQRDSISNTTNDLSPYKLHDDVPCGTAFNSLLTQAGNRGNVEWYDSISPLIQVYGATVYTAAADTAVAFLWRMSCGCV